MENKWKMGSKVDLPPLTLSLTALIISFGERAQHGAIQRYAAKYDIADNWSLTNGVALYKSGSGAMKNRTMVFPHPIKNDSGIQKPVIMI